MTDKIQPLVSVCIPLYNGKAFIQEAIQSVLSQTYPVWELIITDDQSIDGSAQIVRSMADSRIRFQQNPKRLGAEGNWNRCLSEGKGIYLKLFCQDDRLHPTCLARQVAAFEAPGSEQVILVASARRIISPTGRAIMVRRWKRVDQRISGWQAIRQNVRAGINQIGEPSAVLFRAADWKASGGFTGSLPYVIDLEFWFRLLAHGDCHYLSEPLCDFRVSSGSWSSRLGKVQSAQFCELVARTAGSDMPPLRRLDRMAGMAKSKVVAILRRIIYQTIAKNESKRPPIPRGTSGSPTNI